MGFKDAIRVSRRSDAIPSPPATPHEVKAGPFDKRGRQASKDDATLSSANDPALLGKQPKRSASFGRSLGGLSSIASGLTRKPSSGGSTPPIAPATTLAAANATSIGAGTGNATMGPPTVPESSHLAQFSLKLSELINKAFLPCSGAASGNANGGTSTTLAGAAKNAAVKTATAAYTTVPSLATISYEGRKLPNKSVISEIAMLVVAELDYAASVDDYLLRAVSRQALKALTPFADRIDALVVQPAKDPAATQIPTTAKEGVHLPPALEYNLGLVTLEYIVEDALERCIEGPPGSIDDGMPSFVSEILTPVRKRMEGTILHVIQPILSSAKASLTSTLSKAVMAPFAGYGNSLSPIASNASAAASVPSSVLGTMSPPIAASTSVWLRELDGKVDGARKLLIPRLVDRCGQDGEGWFISVVIYAIWKGLLTLTSRSLPVPTALASQYPTAIGNPSLQQFAAEVSKRSPSPAQLTSALKSVSVVGRARKVPTDGQFSAASGVATPSSTHHGSGSHAALTACQQGNKATMQLVSDLQSFEKVMRKFASGFTIQENRKSSGRKGDDDDSSDSDSDDDEDELARAALTEALQAIRSTILVTQWLDVEPEAILGAASRGRGRATIPTTSGSPLPTDVVHAAKAIPPLLLLHLVYSRMPTNHGVFALQTKPGVASSDPILPSPPAAFGYTWTVYERAIAGFGGGQTWAMALAEAWRQDIEESWADIKSREDELKLPKSSANSQYGIGGAGSNQSSKIALHQHERSPSLLASSDEHEEQGDEDELGKLASLTSTQPEDAHLSVNAVSLDPSESTPTPASVLMSGARDRTSPATSAGGSSDSLPEHMTQSAPTLRHDREETVRAGDAEQANSASNQAAPRTTKDRPTWGFIRKTSRKQSGSGTSSPPQSLSPNESPPQTPSSVAVAQGGQEVRPQGVATPTRRFWRTHSSQSVAGAAAGLQQDGRPSNGNLFLPMAANGGSRTRAMSGTQQGDANAREHDRTLEEIRLEISCLRLLSRALDAIEPQRTASTAANAPVVPASAAVPVTPMSMMASAST